MPGEDREAGDDFGAAPAWFVDLAREHYTPALRHATRLLRNGAEAEDCVQEAFAEIGETLAGCRAILDGAVDELPEGAFAYAGTLDDVRRHARAGIERRYGR